MTVLQRYGIRYAAVGVDVYGVYQIEEERTTGACKNYKAGTEAEGKRVKGHASMAKAQADGLRLCVMGAGRCWS